MTKLRSIARNIASRFQARNVTHRMAQYWNYRLDACPVCGNPHLEDYLQRRWNTLPISLKKCAGCNLVVQSPRLTDEGLGQYYTSDYRDHGDVEKSETLFQRGGRRGRYILEFLQEHGACSSNGSVIEIGCGHGGILDVFREAGFKTAGVDPDPGAAAFGKSKGLGIEVGGMEQMSHLRGTADIVVLSHVVEHIADPVSFLAAAAKLLRPGGAIYIEVPGIENPRVVAGNLGVQPGHLIYFDRVTLETTVRQAGLGIAVANDIVQALARPGEKR